MDMMEQHYFLESQLLGKVLEDEPMSKHTSWRTGGRARRAYVPADIDDLAKFLPTVPVDEPIYFVGLGSNLLVRDGGYPGTIIFTHGALGQLRIVDRKLRVEDDNDGAHSAPYIYAEVGVASPKVARFAAIHGFAGAEFLAGIPGTVGGALAMNAGCYGGETWNHVVRVLTMNRQGKLIERTPSNYEVGYRQVKRKAPNSELSTQNSELDRQHLELGTQEFFVAAWFNFPQGDGTQAKQRIRELLEKRIRTQPLELPNAGSVFRNPQGDHAARLIEACGLKGLRVGGAEVSMKHANFIVNPEGKASARDIETLIATVRATVKQMHGIELEQEVRVIGEVA